MIDLTTDSKNRTAGEIRRDFVAAWRKPRETGSVGWVFSSKGHFTIGKSAVTEDQLMTIALDAGAEDINSEDTEVYEVHNTPGGLRESKKAWKRQKIPTLSAEVTLLPRRM
jgi:transcriptional/translational regulatory protein YebC/TACO1